VDAARCAVGDRSAFGDVCGAPPPAAPARGLVGRPVAGQLGIGAVDGSATVVLAGPQLATAGMTNANPDCDAECHKSPAGPVAAPLLQVVAATQRDGLAPLPVADLPAPPQRLAHGARSRPACALPRRPLMYNYMVVGELSEADADLIFHALADATRRDILVRVIRAEQSVSALARHYPMSFAAVQKHVSVLEKAALVSKERRGREQLVRIEVTALRRAGRLLDEYERLWRHRVRGIEQLLAEDSGPGTGSEREDMRP
jgi:DNA-binding transcriptional ArsR family regulator